MRGDDLHRLEDWLGDYMQSLGAGEMRKLSGRIMRDIRRENVKRIAANVEPDGSKMAARKPRKNRRGQTIANKAKMFRNLRLSRNLKFRASAEGGELYFARGSMGKVAAEHHFGEDAYIGKAGDGRTIRARMTQRRLLGFSDKDNDAILNAVIEHLDQD